MERPRKPWDRQPGESQRAYEAFLLYLHTPPARRSLRGTARECSKSASLIFRWSRNHHWGRRCEAWDADLARARHEAVRREITEMHHRHLALVTSFQERLARRLRDLDPASLSAADIARWLSVAVRIEREARGLALRDLAAQREELAEARDLLNRLLADPVATDLTLEALDRVAGVRGHDGHNSAAS